jgi:hypothetical protein
MGDNRAPWAEGRRALVRWRSLWGGEWVECVGMMVGETSDVFHNPPLTIPARKAWKALTRGGRVDDGLDKLETRPLPDHCGTCFLPFGCGCPGDGWSVPVHVRLPDVMAGVSLATYDTTTRNVKSLFVADLSRPRRWFNRFTRGARDAGRECSPLVPFRNGAPIYLKPWGEP